MRSIVAAMLALASLGLLSGVQAYVLSDAPAALLPPTCKPPKYWDVLLQKCACPPPMEEDGDSCRWPDCYFVSCPLPCPDGWERWGHFCLPPCPEGTTRGPLGGCRPDPKPHDPACEEGQPWIGYRSTEVVQAVAQDAGYLRLGACEGEQWDGEDPVRPEGDPCETHADLTDVATPSLSFCHGPDPNACCEPFGARFGFDDGLYGAVGAHPAANVAVFVAPRDSGVVGAVYVRDNTPGNLLFPFYSMTGVDKGHAAEGDCDQATYEEAARTGDRSLCGRDNTAFGAYAGLP